MDSSGEIYTIRRGKFVASHVNWDTLGILQQVGTVRLRLPGFSALQLQRQLGIRRYETAWAMLQKLRRAMVRPDKQKGVYVSYAPLSGLNKLGADRAARIGAAVGPRDPSFLMGNPS